MKQEYIDITSYSGDGYRPMIDFEHWRVAVLRYCEELEIQNLKTMQKHDETDEVFVLLEGNCMLFTGGKGEEINDIDGVAMEPLRLYNIKKGTWHTHTLSKASTVLIVENQDTSDVNSPTLKLSMEQIEELRILYNKLK
jgi:hypothetical protein